ncbi:putative UDP-glucuronosyl/UDP-glucosyltransferase [Helianthus annuus]|nr:putative UDP-glucuronosyl/UDP-glucosyltransferase [Helianthus annuus]
MANGSSNLHVVFIPLLVRSHMIPLVQVARLFAARGVRSTIVTTVHNSLTIQPSIDRDLKRDYPITVRTINFPSSEVGLPTGIENLSAYTNAEMGSALVRAMHLLQTPMKQLIRDIGPDCIFSDMFMTWTVDLADELNIPRLSFYPNSFFYQSVSYSLRVHAPHANVKSEFESFVVPNLPDNIRMKSSQLSHHFRSKTIMGDALERVQESEKRSYGLVHNTFYEIEPAYADHINKIKGKKVWHIGPLFQFFNRDGGVVSEKHSCLSWLDDQKPKSVIFVCFGSEVPKSRVKAVACNRRFGS